MTFARWPAMGGAYMPNRLILPPFTAALVLSAEAVHVDGSRRHPNQFPFGVVALAMVRLDQTVALHAFQFSADLPGGERLDVEPKPPGAEPSA